VIEISIAASQNVRDKDTGFPDPIACQLPDVLTGCGVHGMTVRATGTDAATRGRWSCPGMVGAVRLTPSLSGAAAR
jgi:hypothetical protein